MRRISVYRITMSQKSIVDVTDKSDDCGIDGTRGNIKNTQAIWRVLKGGMMFDPKTLLPKRD